MAILAGCRVDLEVVENGRVEIRGIALAGLTGRENGGFPPSGVQFYGILTSMTRLMEKAIERLRAVPETQQDQVAQFLLNELAEDDRWSRSTAQNEGKVKALVNSILADDDRKVCEPLDPDRL
jgi:hypothetical protein